MELRISSFLEKILDKETLKLAEFAESTRYLEIKENGHYVINKRLIDILRENINAFVPNQIKDVINEYYGSLYSEIKSINSPYGLFLVAQKVANYLINEDILERRVREAYNRVRRLVETKANASLLEQGSNYTVRLHDVEIIIRNRECYYDCTTRNIYIRYPSQYVAIEKYNEIKTIVSPGFKEIDRYLKGGDIEINLILLDGRKFRYL